MIQPHNNATTALTGFSKITHELKNKLQSDLAAHLYQWTAVKERWLVWDEVSAAPHQEPSAATRRQVSACSARAEKCSRFWWYWCLSPPSGHFSSHTLWPCCARLSGTGKCLRCKSTRREIGEGAAGELPSSWLPDVPLSEQVPAYQSAGS